MTVIGYIRVSSDKQDVQKQEHLLLKYAQQHDLHIGDFIKVEISSRKNSKERRIDELLTRLNKDDVLFVAELSRLGRNMFEGQGKLHILFSYPFCDHINPSSSRLPCL